MLDREIKDLMWFYTVCNGQIIFRDRMQFRPHIPCTIKQLLITSFTNLFPVTKLINVI